jgi:hypothetical protein
MTFTPHVYQGVVATDDAFGYQMPDGNLSHRLDYRGRNRASTTPAGTVVVGAAAGAGASASLVAGSTDDIGTLTINLNGTPTTGVLATITFHDPFVNAPFVQLQGRDALGVKSVYYATTTTTQLVLNAAVAPASTGTIQVDYDCTGGQ